MDSAETVQIISVWMNSVNKFHKSSRGDILLYLDYVTKKKKQNFFLVTWTYKWFISDKDSKHSTVTLIRSRLKIKIQCWKCIDRFRKFKTKTNHHIHLNRRAVVMISKTKLDCIIFKTNSKSMLNKSVFIFSVFCPMYFEMFEFLPGFRFSFIGYN